MRVLAIDPGYERLGIAIIDKKTPPEKKDILIYSDCFKTSAKLEFKERLLLIGFEIENLIAKYKPKALAIENLFLSTNQKTAMRVAEVRGAILFICSKSSLNILEMTPLQIKLAVTGNGRSDKRQMTKMVEMLIKTDINKKTLDDEFDAIAAGIAYFALSTSR